MLGNVSRQVIVLIATVLRAILVLCVKVSVCLPSMQPSRRGVGASCPVDMLSNLSKEDYFCTYVINLYS